jgi:DNA-directed RNA polymerase subunit RPC12/RpoP
MIDLPSHLLARRPRHIQPLVARLWKPSPVPPPRSREVLAEYGRCPVCKYQLHGLPLEGMECVGPDGERFIGPQFRVRCTECGTRVDVTALMHDVSWRHRPPRYRAAISMERWFWGGVAALLLLTVGAALIAERSGASDPALVPTAPRGWYSSVAAASTAASPAAPALGDASAGAKYPVCPKCGRRHPQASPGADQWPVCPKCGRRHPPSFVPSQPAPVPDCYSV